MPSQNKTPRTSLKLPITLAVVMIVLVVILTVGWILTTVFASFTMHPALFWGFLTIGSLFLLLILAGTITYLVLSIKMVNLNQRQSNFINSVTHELKSPLASLKLYLQTLNRYDVAPEEKIRFYGGMMEEVERLDALINQVLRAGQLEAGLKIGDAPEEIHVREMLLNAIQSAKICHRTENASFRLECEDLSVVASRVPMDMIFRNLIDNAIKYGGSPPLVRIRVKPMGKFKIAFRITDNGDGIPPKMREKVFQRFVRLGRELERRRKGTGLGLYIVRMCLRQLDGEIRIRDNKRQPGTTIYVLIPRAPRSLRKKQKKLETPYPAAPEINHES